MKSSSGLSNLPPDLDASATLADLADAVDAADLTLVGWQVLCLEHIKSTAFLTTSSGWIPGSGSESGSGSFPFLIKVLSGLI
jgi:hypothetical protein